MTIALVATSVTLDFDMSMIHSSYFFDWRIYERDIAGFKLKANVLKDWDSAVVAIRRIVAGIDTSRLPEWRSDLLDPHLDSCSELLRKRLPGDLEELRDLHFLGILALCTDEAPAAEYYWDVLKTAIARACTQKDADELVLGFYWEGAAWEFADTLVSYQFGFVRPKDVPRLLGIADGVQAEDISRLLAEADLSNTYPVYRKAANKTDIESTQYALANLKSSLDVAKQRECGLLYLLD